MAQIVGVTITLAPDIERQAMSLTTQDRIAIANQGEAQIRAEAPVETGSFRDHVEVEVDGDRVSVVDTDPGAEWIEYGNSHQPAHATMVGVLSRYGKYSGVQPRGRGRRR